MSDLISREVWSKELREYCDKHKQYALHIDEISYLIANAPAIEQGEVVAYLYRCQHKQPNPKYTEWACVSNNAHWPVDQWQSYDVLPLYTTPQQPQEQDELVRKAVADALEKAAKIVMNVYVKPTAEEYGTLCDARDSIRALIKRNAEGVGNNDSKDAERYRWLKKSPTWTIDWVKNDGTRFNSADRFASAKSGDWSNCIPEWSVSFCTNYGTGEDDDDLDKAIDSAISKPTPKEGE